MIARSEATVVPIFFEGHNSRLFQVASHLHYTLRLNLLIREFRARLGTSVRVVIGQPLPRSALDTFGSDTKAMMRFLRQATYDLSPSPLASHQLGYEFEEKYRTCDMGPSTKIPSQAFARSTPKRSSATAP